MTQTIIAIPAPPGPNNLRVTITCEGDHGMLGVPQWSAEGGDYMAMRHQATAAGWKRTGSGTWLCPGCR